MLQGSFNLFGLLGPVLLESKGSQSRVLVNANLAVGEQLIQDLAVVFRNVLQVAQALLRTGRSFRLPRTARLASLRVDEGLLLQVARHPAQTAVSRPLLQDFPLAFAIALIVGFRQGIRLGILLRSPFGFRLDEGLKPFDVLRRQGGSFRAWARRALLGRTLGAGLRDCRLGSHCGKRQKTLGARRGRRGFRRELLASCGAQRSNEKLIPIMHACK